MITISGRTEHKQRSIEKMQEILDREPEYVKGFYNSLLNSKEYLTAQNYTLAVLRFLNVYDITEFTEDNINTYLLSLKGRKGECSDSFKVGTQCALNKFGEYLVRRELLETNPMSSIDRGSVKDRPQKVSMSPDELRVILERIENNDIGTEKEKSRRELWVERNYAIFSLMITTGMRVTALVEINLEDYNPREGKLTVTEKRKETFEYELEDGTIKAIDNWLAVRKRLLKDESCDALFISNRRKRMTTKSIRDLVAVYTEGIDKHITPHKFRASFATNLHRETGDIYFVQQAIGHKQITTTQRYIDMGDVSKTAATTIRKTISL